MTVMFTDVMQQRHAKVDVLEDEGTVGHLVAEAVNALNLPQQSQRGIDLDYAARTADGTLLRPSEALTDERVRTLLEEGENVAVPRLTAAGS